MNSTDPIPTYSCPYGCAGRRAFDPARRFCNQCRGWLSFCPDPACRAPGRLFARFCRACRKPLEAWERFPSLGGGGLGGGALPRTALGRDPHALRMTSPWVEGGPVLGHAVTAPCLVAAYGIVAAASQDGTLAMVDLRDGAVLDRFDLGERPVSLYAWGESMMAVSARRLRVLSLMGREGRDLSARAPVGWKKLFERPLSDAATTHVGVPVPHGQHLVVAIQSTGSFSLSCIDMNAHVDRWAGDATRSFAGEFGFLLSHPDRGLLVGDREGRVVGLTGLQGLETIRMELPGGHDRSQPRVALAQDGVLYYVDSSGDLRSVSPWGDREARTVGALSDDQTSILGVSTGLGPSAGELVLGTRRGHLLRANRFGLDVRSFDVARRADGDLVGFTVPPVLTSDGGLAVAGDGGQLCLFGPRSQAAPREYPVGFRRAGRLTAGILVASHWVAASSVGELAAVRIMDEEVPKS